MSLTNLRWEKSGSIKAILSKLGEADHNLIVAILILW